LLSSDERLPLLVLFLLENGRHIPVHSRLIHQRVSESFERAERVGGGCRSAKFGGDVARGSSSRDGSGRREFVGGRIGPVEERHALWWW
jgi:hypothetical protein